MKSKGGYTMEALRFRISKSEREKLEKIAEQTDRNLSEVLRDLVSRAEVAKEVRSVVRLRERDD